MLSLFTTIEQWKEINYFPDYKISNFGRLKRHKNSVVPIFLNSKGYYKTTLWKDDKPYIKTIHKLVALNWIEKPSNDKNLQVDHINRIRTDNRVVNLRWLTQQENLKHRFFKAR